MILSFVEMTIIPSGSKSVIRSIPVSFEPNVTEETGSPSGVIVEVLFLIGVPLYSYMLTVIVPLNTFVMTSRSSGATVITDESVLPPLGVGAVASSLLVGNSDWVEE